MNAAAVLRVVIACLGLACVVSDLHAQAPVIRNAYRDAGDFVMTWAPPTNRFIVRQARRLGMAEICCGSSTSVTVNTVSVPFPSEPAAFYHLQVGLQAVPTDAGMRRAIQASTREQSGPTNAVYDIDLAGMTTLYGTGRDVGQLDGIDAMPVLESAFLSGNRIAAIDVISHAVSLVELSLAGSLVTDLSGLSTLTAMEWLDLWNNDVSNMAPLAALTNLVWLNLGSNAVSHLDALRPLVRLRALNIGGNGITDLSPIEGLRDLEFLHAWDNNVNQLPTCTGLLQLAWLELSGNSVSDIGPLSQLTNLAYVGLAGNAVVDVGALVLNAEAGGLGPGDVVDLRGNPLSTYAQTNQLPRLGTFHGVEVLWP